MYFTLAPLLMAVGGAERAPLPKLALGVVSKIALHPFVLATAVGVGAAYLELRFPVALERYLDLLARGAAPCALFAMGVTLALRPFGRAPVELLPLALLKLVVHPALVYVVLGWIGSFDPSWVFTAVLLAALPTATNVFVIANQYGVWTERASAAILLTTCASVLTLTLLIYAAKSGMLPPDPFP
jgi:malonate transporter and related proteins